MSKESRTNDPTANKKMEQEESDLLSKEEDDEEEEEEGEEDIDGNTVFITSIQKIIDLISFPFGSIININNINNR